jgi:undecaprenyl-phosphate 4-deoxy-4-formamido-L-arabinose transferase
MESVSVVVPVYRGEKSIEELVVRTLRVFDEERIDGEIILVNDDSPDGSWTLIESLASRDERVRGILLMRNFGQHAALLCGIRSATKRVIVTMDDDLQHRPESIPLLLAKIDEGFDVVYAAAIVMPHAKWRNFLSLGYKRFLAMLIGSDAVRYMSAYRAFRVELRQAFDRFASPNVVLDFLLAWASTRYVTIFVQHDYRKHGSTTYSIRRLVYNVLVILTGYTVKPLHVATLVGFTFTLFGLAVFVYAAILGLTRHSLPGFPFIAALISLMGGVQLFCLGILGEYLARIHLRTSDRPMYVVRDQTTNKRLHEMTS